MLSLIIFLPFIAVQERKKAEIMGLRQQLQQHDEMPIGQRFAVLPLTQAGEEESNHNAGQNRDPVVFTVAAPPPSGPRIHNSNHYRQPPD